MKITTFSANNGKLASLQNIKSWENFKTKVLDKHGGARESEQTCTQSLHVNALLTSNLIMCVCA